ncbi:MAG TPA: CDP-diacylglycerol--serine O-phosphatidyltransferase [Bryobacteraceae bacterium]|nr:CDP-diacylglycerol--serine O-phosphatidyltransferase [Bryobacteraceae bacterium]
MGVRALSQRWIGPGPDGRPRPRAAYALPTLFTAGNVFLGFVSIMRSVQGALFAGSGSTGPNEHFRLAAVLIGWAVLLDGLDGRIARLTNTVSEFGREMDSLADVITFGIAPAVLAFTWGVQLAIPGIDPMLRDHVRRIGFFIPFLFLLCGAARLARFNVQKNPVPKNPGRPDRKYFVGLPIPAGAALVAAIVYVSDGTPIQWWPLMAGWLVLLAALSFLMVSTWRYQSFKDVQLLHPRSWLTIVLWGSMIFLLWTYTPQVLLGVTTAYVGSGIVVRLGGIVRRRFRRSTPEPEHQLG